jgi:REP element-mobilizing transposase RayT
MPSKFDPEKHHRKSIRLQGYDYSQAGAYFVTIVTWRRDCLFGNIVNGEMELNDFGKIANECWQAIPAHFGQVELGAYMIMPNHVHGVIIINDVVGAQQCCAPTLNGKNENRHKINVKPGSLGGNCSLIQICRFLPHQQTIQHHRYLATQLLRTHHPQRP